MNTLDKFVSTEPQAVNDSGLVPVGRAILVEPFEPEREASRIALPDWVRANERVLDVRVRCVEVGPEAWKATRVGDKDEPPRCWPGDIIFVAKFSGFVTQGPKDGKPYRLVNDKDVFARVTWFGEET